MSPAPTRTGSPVAAEAPGVALPDGDADGLPALADALAAGPDADAEADADADADGSGVGAGVGVGVAAAVEAVPPDGPGLAASRPITPVRPTSRTSVATN